MLTLQTLATSRKLRLLPEKAPKAATNTPVQHTTYALQI